MPFAARRRSGTLTGGPGTDTLNRNTDDIYGGSGDGLSIPWMATKTSWTAAAWRASMLAGSARIPRSSTLYINVERENEVVSSP